MGGNTERYSEDAVEEKENIVEDILKTFDESVKELSAEKYGETLKELTADLQIRLEAWEEENEEKE